MLAAPWELRIVADGKTVALHSSTFHKTGQDEEAVEFVTRGDSAEMCVSARWRVEFDGVGKIDLELKPHRELCVDSVDLIIPLCRRSAKLFHHGLIYPIYVWDWPTKSLNSGEVSEEGMKLPFVFHIWLGDEERGIQLFAESDEHLRPADENAAISVTNESQQTILRLSLLSNVKLNNAWTWTFGFVATPVKPYPKNHYKLHYCQSGTYGIEKEQEGGHKPLLDVYKEMGVNYLGCHEHWSEEQSLPRSKNPEELSSLIDACHSKGIRVAVYTGCYMSTRSKEYDELWNSLPFGHHYQHQRSDNGHICRVQCNNTGYPDLLLQLYTDAIPKLGIDGLYMDGLTFPLPCTNSKHGCGYTGKDGKVHPTMAIWKTREMMKRFYRLIKGRNRDGIIVAHTSACILTPIISFADFYLDGEHLMKYLKFPPKDPPDGILRAEMSGHNFGVPGMLLPLGLDEAERQRARTVSLLHDILWMWSPNDQMDAWKAFDSFGAAEAKWIPFWRSHGFVKVAGSESVRISLYLRRGVGALMVIGNVGETAESVTIKPKLEAMGLKFVERLIVKDEVAEKQIAFDGSQVLVEVPAGAYRAISVGEASDANGRN